MQNLQQFVSGFNPRRPRGRQLSSHLRTSLLQSFNPRRPRGRRLIGADASIVAALFQSTPPARAATLRHTVFRIDHRVSIHAAREGGDRQASGRPPRQGCFNPRRPRGRRPADTYTGIDSLSLCFNPRRPRGRRPDTAPRNPNSKGFNPRRPRGRRHPPGEPELVVASFQSTPPARAATTALRSSPSSYLFQSTPPARAATSAPITSFPWPMVSIHAAREGGDGSAPETTARRWTFQSTPPARAATLLSGPSVTWTNQFQSTPPARAATRQEYSAVPRARGFNPRRPRGRRPRGGRKPRTEHVVSIHAAREGGDSKELTIRHAENVSIHAAREGGDQAATVELTM